MKWKTHAPKGSLSMRTLKLLTLLAALPSLSSGDQATEFPNLPVAITSFGATCHNQAIYVYGGQLGAAHSYSWDQVNKPLYRLKLEPGAEWEELASDEPALGPTLWTHDRGVIRVGGMQPRNAEGDEQNLVSVPYVRLFDPESGEWSQLVDLPTPRSSHDSIIVDNKIYVVGGWQMKGKDYNSSWIKTVEVLDLSAERLEWRSIEQPFLRRALSVAVVGDELFCMGGLDNGGDTSLEVDILDLETEEWRKGPELPEGPMDGFGISGLVDADDGKLYITGFSGKVHAFNGKDGWDEVAKFEHGRFFSRFVDPPGAPLIVLGGVGKEGRSQVVEQLPEGQ